MPVDASRAAFVSQPFRYETAEDLSVRSNFVQAREITIDTQLSSASAATLATTILTATKGHALEFTVELDGVLNLEDFDGTVNQYTLSFPQYATDARSFRLVSCEVDYAANITKIRVRG